MKSSFVIERIKSERYERIWFFILHALAVEAFILIPYSLAAAPQSNRSLVILGLIGLTILPGCIASLFMVDLSKSLIIDQSKLIVYKISTISRKAYLKSFKNLLIQKNSGQLSFPVKIESIDCVLLIDYYISSPEQYVKFLSSGIINVEQALGKVLDKDTLTLREFNDLREKVKKLFPFETYVRFNFRNFWDAVRYSG